MIRFARYTGLAVVFAWFFFGGISHFTNVAFFMAIMPPYVPLPLAAVYASGVFEVLLAIGIVIPVTRQWSGNLLMLLTLAVTPANVHMWLHPERFPDVAPALLSVRLFVQALLLMLIWWSTRTPRAASAHVEPAGA
jgi:uncharacterized membrane protein